MLKFSKIEASDSDASGAPTQADAEAGAVAITQEPATEKADLAPVQHESRRRRLVQHAVQHAVTAVLIFVWYASSIVCNQTSKDLLGAGVLTSATLTLAQSIISVFCGPIMLLILRHPCSLYAFRSRKQALDTAQLAVVFTGGFFALNASLAAMHVSLVMVLRAAEPLTTLLLARLLLPPSGWPSRRKAAAILPVVLGCSISAIGPHGPTFLGLSLVIASNGCFSMRAILGKRITTEHGTTALPLFWQLCIFGLLLQAALLPISNRAMNRSHSTDTSAAAAPEAAAAAAGGAAAAVVLPARPFPYSDNHLPSVVLNGASFYAYNALSFCVLMRISAVSHAVANSMRRPATILAALLYEPVGLSPLNYAGIAVACCASLLYGLL